MTDYLSKGSTVTGAYYADELRKLLEALKSKHWGKLRHGVLLLHDNAPAHTSAVAMSTAAECGYELLTHPPCSLDLVLSPTCNCSHCWKNTWVAHIIKWQWRHCIGGGLSSGARWTFLQDWYTEAAETMEQVHWSWWRLCGKINWSLLLCWVSLYMRPETFGTTLVCSYRYCKWHKTCSVSYFLLSWS